MSSITQSVRRGSFAWTTADIAVGAALGVACGVIFWAFNFAYSAVSPLLGAVLPGCASLLHAVWYFSGTFAMLILRKPGAAIYVNVVGCIAQMLLGSQFDVAFVLISAIPQGVCAEIPFALTRYRSYTLPLSICSGLCAALEYGLYLLFVQYQGVAFLSPRGITHMICELIGGALICGVGSWAMYRAIRRTGALDHLSSGRK
ncbi:ECF transporter S component [Bifidobacterium magnum]|uniref:ABC-type Thiamin transporter, permease n=1 Tax=Bifidobacterium magnum TaxID=1692 RepID=A0A087BBP1_9BIFI|nr:ECF transporter S component [Bifidobacterium magnum]KFI68441.1 ABC-type Thiamin transporter, permease [Bifidobacterium magnum]